MSISASIAPHLPFLRRFARALSGSQPAGDAFVVALLEALLSDPASFPTELDPRVGLYRSFLKVWNERGFQVSPGAPVGATQRNLAAITPLPRQAFLLTSVEGFSAPEAALALDVSSEDLAALLDQAGRDIANQVATGVLIIEDEPLIALDLEGLVQGLGHTVTAVARTRDQAVRSATNFRPGLVLADIQLADGSSGLDAVSDILDQFDVPVIFITAFPERVLTGKRPEPAFLISKPFQAAMVRAVISQALFFGMDAHASTAVRTQLGSKR